jgi:hypothetical protein
MFCPYSSVQKDVIRLAVGQPPQEDNAVNNVVEDGRLGVVLVLGTIITSGIWLLNRLFPQVISTPPATKLPRRGDLPVESETPPRNLQRQPR